MLDRYCLNYRSIPYRTEWVELSDIEKLCTTRGIPPSKINSEGKKSYTLPAIHNSDDGTYVSDSATIMRYLDGIYPQRPLAFPKGTVVLQTAFLSAFVPKVLAPLWPVIVPAVAMNLNPRSKVYFENTREITFGRSIKALEEDVAGRDASWARFKAGLGDIDRWISSSEDASPHAEVHDHVFVMGSEPVFADFVIAATLAYMRNVWGEESVEWKEVQGWHGGRWARFAGSLRKYERVV
ncbi:hypothetical protein D9611_011770 [Ephemerocybe angulata]|uniref:GST N-terminal domain-containing protein n=1 Tax=Ephemerocybe angulata TaxID=980116 RepID=A0A8H5C529_9AGAR|nr:hypothetical protein D9611_011770 [Tulosesus angulatus]